MRIALLGAGSVGTIVGALLSRGGEDIVLVDTYRDHVDALNEHGACIVGGINCTIPVRAILPEEMDGVYDLIISMTKLTHIEASLRNALPYMHPDTVVLTLQNGIPEDIAAAIVGPDRVMGGGVEFGGTWLEPGISEMTSDPSALAITFGQLDGRTTPRTRQVQACMAHIGHAAITGNLLGVRYSKLTDNSTFSAMSTILACDNGTILDSEEAMTAIAHLGREAARVIEKLGVTPEEIFGLKPTVANLGFTTRGQMQKVIRDYWTPIYTPFRPGIASMLQDIQKGRKCEINHINGKFVDLGHRIGVEVPFMETALAIITKMQDGELPIDNAWQNLQYFRFPTLGS
jgi:2-dehydropantoate 2-reductase